MSVNSIVPLEDGWDKLKNEGIKVLEEFLDTGHIRASVPQNNDPTKPRNVFSKAEYAELYTTVYNMCTQRTPNNWSEQLYRRYGDAMSDYVQRQVLPALKDKTDIALMKELLRRWTNHKIYVKWMERFFTYLDRYYVKLQSVEPLNNRGYSIFHQLVFEECKKDTRTALLRIINLERQGEHIDQDLVKGIIDMFIDLGLGNPNVYNNEFEEAFLPATSDYFVRQASGWLSEDSFPEYLRKAEAALNAEEQRVTNYLHRSTQPKLKHVVIQALLAQPQAQLLEKETGVVYLLDNDKREDLARMHRVFSLVDNGLNPIAHAFRQYVTDRGNKIVDERVEQSKQMASKSEALGDPSFIQTLLDLHDRFKGIVQECFSQGSLGAAGSSLCAMDMEVNLGYSGIRLLNFGEPRVGNKAYYSAALTYLPGLQRMVDYEDCVPKLPPEAIGYYHEAYEIYEHPTGADTYKVCDSSGEDQTCSDSVGENCDDHLHYMGVQCCDHP